MATFETIAKYLSAFVHHEAGGPAQVQVMTRGRVARLIVPADAAAGDARNIPLLRAEQAIIVQSIRIIPAADVTEHDTNYATLDLSTEDGLAGGFTSVQAVTTKITGGIDLDARVLVAPFTSAVGLAMAAGRTLWIVQTKAAAGTAISQLCIEVHYDLA